MNKARRTLNFLEQQRIEVQSVSAEWRPVAGKRGEVRIKSFHPSGLDLPNDSRLWLQVKSPLGILKACLGDPKNPNLDVSLPLNEELVAGTTVRIYITSGESERQIVASVHHPIPLIDSRNQRLPNLLARELKEGLGVGIPWKLDLTRESRIVLLLNSDWEGLFNETDMPWFTAMVMGDIIRQIALHVGNPNTPLGEEARDAWTRCFCDTYSCGEPPNGDDSSDPQFQESLTIWAEGVARRVAEANEFKKMYETTRRSGQ